MINQSLEPNTADDFGDGPTELVIDHGVVKKVRRGRQKTERPKPDPFKTFLSGESERTGLGLRRIHAMLPPKVLKDWSDVDDMVEHCLRRSPDVAVNPQLAAAIGAVYQAQPDKEGFIGLGIRSGYEASTHNGTYGSNKHQSSSAGGRHGDLDRAFERMVRTPHPDVLSTTRQSENSQGNEAVAKDDSRSKDVLIQAGSGDRVLLKPFMTHAKLERERTGISYPDLYDRLPKDIQAGLAKNTALSYLHGGSGRVRAVSGAFAAAVVDAYAALPDEGSPVVVRRPAAPSDAELS